MLIILTTGTAHISYKEELLTTLDKEIIIVDSKIDIVKCPNYNVEISLFLTALKKSRELQQDEGVFIISDRIKPVLNKKEWKRWIKNFHRKVSDDFVILTQSCLKTDKHTPEAVFLSSYGRDVLLSHEMDYHDNYFHPSKYIMPQIREMSNRLPDGPFVFDHKFNSYPECDHKPTRADVVILPQVNPPPQFRISGLVWFIFVTFIVLILAWCLIKIGPGGHKTINLNANDEPPGSQIFEGPFLISSTWFNY